MGAIFGSDFVIPKFQVRQPGCLVLQKMAAIFLQPLGFLWLIYACFYIYNSLFLFYFSFFVACAFLLFVFNFLCRFFVFVHTLEFCFA